MISPGQLAELFLAIRRQTGRIWRVLFLGWALLFVAIISCGVAICFLSYAVEAASRQTLYVSGIYHGAFALPYWRLAQTASSFLLVAGATFTLALLTLIAAAWLAITRLGREGEKDAGGAGAANDTGAQA